ncbi:uncharacterized protein N7484_002715 [Penicillium longicatenatum]|uniref:uncharacterized protein n=1 Tax=Penicillium longicatenatum TaxID=1561947 RepID=UPI002547F944|nr:uncharacterized protein N7484_002715 [Penicillium longicatenatum]KAJ5648992.1 hypothetical protein N7484_002715 [Penicillium longicatenatum]
MTSRLPQFDPHISAHGYSGYATAPTAELPRHSTIVSVGPVLHRAWYGPRGWSLRKKLIVVGCIVIVIVGVVVGAVEGVNLNKYPGYSKLSYTLNKDTTKELRPEHGDIDVMASNNRGTRGDAMTLHTSKNCKMNTKRKRTGTAKYTNCLVTANCNAGCGVEGKISTYGEAFNNNGGGVYAMELRDDKPMTSPTRAIRLIPPHGGGKGGLWLISRTHIVTSVLIFKTRVLSQTSISVVVWLKLVLHGPISLSWNMHRMGRGEWSQLYECLLAV